ncbi:MAG: hypothetical protein GY761_03890 [Hyphomicrobiales bacterium]|nr:hypothetical protein [Hyphomicrobiales bacterium]
MKNKFGMSRLVKTGCFGLLGMLLSIQASLADTAAKVYPAPFNHGDSESVRSYRPLIIVDPEIIDKADFSLRNTLSSILRKGEVVPENKAIEAFLGTLLSTFKEKKFKNPMNNDQLVDVDPIDGFMGIEAIEFLNPGSPYYLVPTAIVNRLDLADEDFQNCGEYRIVYSFGYDKNDIMLKKRGNIKHFSLIFEAQLGNPANSSGNAVDYKMRNNGCLQVANIWDGFKSLEEKEADKQKIADALSKFFYGSIGSRDSRAIHPNNLADLHGQIRGNVKAWNQQQKHDKWQLREWNVKNAKLVRSKPLLEYARSNNLDYSIEATTIKGSPIVEFYDNLGSSNNSDHEATKKLFQNKFVGVYFLNLIKSVQYETGKIDIIGRLGAPEKPIGPFFGKEFNDFDGISDPNKHDRVKFNESRNIGERVTSRIPQNLPNKMTMKKETVITMVQALSCAGCHGFSGKQPILHHEINDESEATKWPSHKNNVHITEPQLFHNVVTATVSPALSQYFLPFRKKGFDDFIANKKAPNIPQQLSAHPLNNSILATNILKLSQPGLESEIADERKQVLLQVENYRYRSRARGGAFVMNRRTH